MSNMLNAFVSYSHTDAEKCYRITEALREWGLDVWIDHRGSPEGSIFIEEIQKALESRNALIVMLSPSSVNSFWVNLEINTFLTILAKDRSRILIPVILEPTEVPVILNTFVRIDAVTTPFDEVIYTIVGALKASVPQFIPNYLSRLGYIGRIVHARKIILPPLCSVIEKDEFAMGISNLSSYAAHTNEHPEHIVRIQHKYRIAKYPVTVAEYTNFIATGLGAEPEDWNKQAHKLDHPVVSISWHDAVAYAKWLSDVTGNLWRLPTEAEWERAARGTDGRIYPWGNKWVERQANVSEGKMGGTTPVGTYTTSTSPVGAYDMAGNVWEWVSSQLKPYPYKFDDGRENASPLATKVSRGGSWRSDLRGARATSRNENLPGEKKDSRGFRLVQEQPA